FASIIVQIALAFRTHLSTFTVTPVESASRRQPRMSHGRESPAGHFSYAPSPPRVYNVQIRRLVNSDRSGKVCPLQTRPWVRRPGRRPTSVTSRNPGGLLKPAARATQRCTWHFPSG